MTSSAPAEPPPPPVDEAGPFERGAALLRKLTGSGWPLIAGSIAVFLVALALIARELSEAAAGDFAEAFHAIDFLSMGACVGLSAASYGLLTFNDRLALRLIGREVAQLKRVTTSVASYAIARTIGYAFITAAMTRMRLYMNAGLSATETSRVSLYTGLMAQAGGATAAALGLILGAHDISTNTIIPQSLSIVAGVLLLLPIAVWLRAHPRRATWSEAKPPSFSYLIWHLAAATGAWICGAGALYVLMPEHGGLNFSAFLACFVAATLIGALSGVPGGIGVFEAAMLAFAPRTQDAPGTAAALILFRLIFNFLPLTLAALVLGVDHAASARRVAAKRAPARKR